MKLTAWGSATVTIETADGRILCDPWCGYGNSWDGSWTVYPPPPPMAERVAAIGPVDLIYVSHLHDDHYCPVFLRALLAASPAARLILPEEPHLLSVAHRDGFGSRIVAEVAGRLGGTEWTIERCYPEGCRAPIDSALAIRTADDAAISLNDCPWDAALVARLRAFAGGRRLLVCLPYLGAGEYPQTYAFASSQAQAVAGAQKCEAFLALFERYCDALAPRWVMPFAGEYWLRGPLARLNAARGVPDALEAVARAHKLGLAAATFDVGGSWDLETERVTGVRTTPIDAEAAQSWSAALDPHGDDYAYARPFDPVRAASAVPRLLLAVGQRIALCPPVKDTYWYAIGPRDGAGWWGAVDLATGDVVPDFDGREPREEVRLDPRHAVGLLAGVFSWNVALGGSHLTCRRVPDVYRPDVYEALNDLHV